MHYHPEHFNKPHLMPFHWHSKKDDAAGFIGKNGFFFIGIALIFLWVILFVTAVQTDGYVAEDHNLHYQTWVSSLNELDWDTANGMELQPVDTPLEPLPFSPEDLNAGEVRHYRAVVPDYAPDGELLGSVYDGFSVYFYPANRQAAFAATRFSPDGGSFSRPTGITAAERIDGIVHPERIVWVAGNRLILYDGASEAIIALISDTYGAPVLDVAADIAPPAAQNDQLALLLHWRRWRTVFELTGLAALIGLCFWAAFRKKRRRTLDAASFAALAATRGLPLLPIDKITADPYDGALGVPFAAFMRDTAAGRRTAEGLNPTEKENARLYVYFYQTAKKAAAARESLSPQGDKLQLNERILRLPYSPDRMIVRHKNLLIYYNGRDEAARKTLTALDMKG